jgi:hypothetical protein
MRCRSVAVVCIGIMGMALMTAACAGSKSNSSSASSKNTFVLGEFSVIPPTNTLHPGGITITANNVGGETHELVIVRADSVSALPMKADGSVDEDKIAEADKVGEIADVAPRSHQSKTFDLAAGSYVAFCNLVDSMMGSSSMMGGHGTGHVHFAEGMVADFTVG